MADLVTKYRTLLVLDGLEPLQYPSGALEGQLKDPALQILLDRVSLSNSGLCLLTTREKVSDLADRERTTAPVLELEHLSSEAGAVLLDQLGVEGTEQELQEASQAFAGHALALTLLGTYLSEVHNGDVRHWKEVPLLEEDASKGGHARRVMQSYQNWLGESPEWSLLQLTGFFDRPAKGAEIQALLADPPIQGITDAILKLDRPSRKRAHSRLRRLRLLSEPTLDDPDGIDAHPLLREYLSEQLWQHHSDACREGHRRLYQHLKESAKEFPDTLEEMMPLYQAGFGADLAAVSSFFDRPWVHPSDSVNEEWQPVLLNQAGMDLRALGRFSEAREPMRIGMEMRIQQLVWDSAARIAGNLSEVHLILGDLPQAVAIARHGVKLADSSEDAFLRIVLSTDLADALHQCGDFAQARSLFQEAERMQKRRQPPYPLLYSMQGFHYSDLLLGECELRVWNPQATTARFRTQAISRCRQVRERAAQTLEWGERSDFSPLGLALDHCTLGRTYLLEATLDASSLGLISAAQHHLYRAVSGLRQAVAQEFMNRGLIACAQLRRVQGSFADALQDLNEATQIASRGPMPLFQADIHLEQSRLHHAQGHLDQARQSLSKARSLIQKHAYHRRDPELNALQKQLGEGT